MNDLSPNAEAALALELEAAAVLLRTISEQYPLQSEERRRLRLLGNAAFFVWLRGLGAFRGFLGEMAGGLAPEQVERLRAMGIVLEDEGEPS